MAKKKRQKPVAEPIQNDVSAEEKSAPKKFPMWIVWLAICFAVSLGLTFYFLYKKPAEQTTKRQIGGVTACQQVPPFVRQLGFGNKAASALPTAKFKA